MNSDDELQVLRQEKAAWKAERAELQAKLAEASEALAQMNQRVKELEERLAKDSHNSHLPPSSDRFSRQKKTRSLRKKSGKKAGGQAGHQGQHLALVEKSDEVVVYAVERCDQCQADLREEPAERVERRQIVEVPTLRAWVVEHRAECKRCPHCQQSTKAAFPEALRAPVQYGTSVGAMAVYLVQQHLIPYARASEILSDLLGVSMQAGTIQNLVQQCAHALDEVEAQIKRALHQEPVIHQDETGLYVGGKRVWMHVTATGKLTHYQVHEKRGKEAMEANGILPGYQGTSVHDGWGPYQGYDCTHAWCNVHLLRDLIWVSETSQQGWAEEMKTLLLDLKEQTEQARNQGRTSLSVQQIQHAKTRYLAILLKGERANPFPLPQPTEEAVKKKGRRKQSAARNLLDRFSKHPEAVLAFVTDLRVPFDNSQAERDIRMVKVQQKISGCFRKEEGAHAFCRIRGYLSTLHKQGMPGLTALEQALVGHPVFPAF